MKAILKQTSWLVLTQLLTRIIGFFYTIFLAKNLGVSDFGLFSISLAYFSLLSSIADFGFNKFLVREVSRDLSKMPKMIYGVAILRLAITSILFILSAFVLYYLDPDKLRVYLILLSFIAVFPQSIALTLDSVFVAIQKLQFSSFALLGLNIVTTLTGIYLLLSGFGVTGALAALILGQVFYVLVLWLLLKKQKIPILISISGADLRKIAKESLPFGILGILGLLYFRIDTFMLSYMKGNFDTGIYGIGYRFLEAVIFIPSALSAALFPRIVNLIQNRKVQLISLYRKSLFLLFAIAVLIVAVYILILPNLVGNILPQYLASIGVIKILALTIPFVFMISVQGSILFSHQKFLKQLLFISIFNLGLNIALNFYLIPQFSYNGAALGTLVSDIVGFTIFSIYIEFSVLKVK